MPYSLSIPQDKYCRLECRCRCGYWTERDADNWAFPPTNPNVTMHSSGESFYARWLKKRPSVGDIWAGGRT